MTFFVLIIVVIAISLAVLVAALQRGRPVALRDWRELPAHTVPVDVEAFRRLLDRDDEQFIRARLTGPQFRVAQRLRARAGFDYVARVRQNAALLLAIGEEAKADAEPVIAEAGERLVHAAIAVRISTTVLLARLAVMLVFPALTADNGSLSELYSDMRWNIERLTSLREPRLTSQMGAAV